MDEKMSGDVVPVILAMDANSHPQIAPVEARTIARGRTENTSVWKTFKGSNSVWSAFFDRDDGHLLAGSGGGGDEGKKGEAKPAEGKMGEAEEKGDWADAWAPVSVNKMRGPDSSQSNKIGRHAYHVIDHVFYNDGETTVGEAHVRAPVRYGEREQALHSLLPTLSNPSDHYPIVVDFE